MNHFVQFFFVVGYILFVLLLSLLLYFGFESAISNRLITLGIIRFRYYKCNEKVVILHTHHRTIW